MKGLLLKDWYQVKTNMRMMYLTVLAVLAIWILSTSGDSSFAVNYSAVFLGMMPAYLLSYDHASGWTEYSFALPLSKELQVAEKYLVGLLCTAVSAALNGIFCGIRFWMGKPLPAMPIGLLLGAGAASILLINGIMLPLYYEFWRRKGADALHADVCRNGRCPGRRNGPDGCRSGTGRGHCHRRCAGSSAGPVCRVLAGVGGMVWKV